jgi:mannitol-1-phosphate 5-dehydrogenase
MKAVQFGAGSIGRGLIGDLLHDTGYEVVFLDIGKEIIDQINSTGSFDLYLIDQNYAKKTINRARAVSSIEDRNTAIEETATADIITTAVQSENLKHIAPLLAAGLATRHERGGSRINVLACENAMRNGELLRSEILKLEVIPEEVLDAIAAFPNTAVDRLVLASNRDGNGVIDVGDTHELVIEKSKLADPAVEPITGAIYVQDVLPYVDRKLYIINCGHAWAGYIGHLSGYTIMQDVLDNDEIREGMRQAMLESAALVRHKYGFPEDELEAYVDFAIRRFRTPGVVDTIARVCRSPIRKLQPEERLVGPAAQCEALGLPHGHLVEGIAAVFKFNNPYDEQSRELLEDVELHGITEAISHYTYLGPETPLHAEILDRYSRLTKGPNTLEAFTNAEGISLVHRVIAEIRMNRDYLSELDGAAGDGDHGINMSKGMTIAADRIAAEEAPNMSAGFATVSSVLMGDIGGSMGPLYGSFFRGLSIASRDFEQIDRDAFGAVIGKGYARIRRVTEAQIGDKTLIDVLQPAVDAYQDAASRGEEFDACLQSLTAAADKGLASTKEMTAKVGRASRLGARSAGHLDAGAASCTIILQAIATAAKELLNNKKAS